MVEISAKARKLAATLTSAQRDAIAGSLQIQDDPVNWYLRVRVRMDVRRRLIEMALAGRRAANPLTKLGREVRELLIAEAARG